MNLTQDDLQRLRTFNRLVRDLDPEIGEETAEFTEGIRAESRVFVDNIEYVFRQESIIMRRNRPVLNIFQDKAVLDFQSQAESEIWKERLHGAAEGLTSVAKSVGRVNLQNSPHAWVGTAWLVGEDIIVTNRHVADYFAARGGEGFNFIQDDGGEILAELDFLKEFDNPEKRVFQLTDVLDIVPRPGPDIAFFRIEQASGDGSLAAPIPLSRSPEKTSSAVVIGYPALDSRIPDYTLMRSIYGDRYDYKRLAPGAVTYVEDMRIFHNCTTLGGNSGSVVFDFVRGEALGLHYSGAFMQTNYAVRSNVVQQALDDARSGRPRKHVCRLEADLGASAGSASQPAANADPRTGAFTQPPGTSSVSVMIPLTVTVSLGEPQVQSSLLQRFSGLAAPFVQGDCEDDDQLDLAEAPAESYLDREGFQPDFLGDDSKLCPLPVLQDEDVLLKFEFDGEDLSVLKYQHFSVAMNEAHRMCAWSAVNIDGGKAQKAARVGWKWDGRIEKRHQIMKECYGNPPKFSRGHMTRRNDPGWGSPTLARLGNQDSMHVTNATPQMQTFNSPVWLELEDYALDNAKEDGMRINVFTGPILKSSDPFFFGVQVPVAFWKVIAFIHDRTGHLTATGYRMDQSSALPVQDEFVFGAFTSSHTSKAAQVSIRSIEQEAKISFGPLTEFDPFSQTENLPGMSAFVPLSSGNQIQFI